MSRIKFGTIVYKIRTEGRGVVKAYVFFAVAMSLPFGSRLRSIYFIVIISLI